MSDVYLRRTDNGGRVVITHHFAWDAPLFLKSQQRYQFDAQAKGQERVRIELATQDEYRAFAWPKKLTKEK
jgi:hypothetical protein